MPTTISTMEDENENEIRFDAADSKCQLRIVQANIHF